MKSIREIEVRYSETDQMGVVYHANYLVWLEIGRTSFLKDLGFNIVDFEKIGYAFPVYSIDIKFLSPAFYDEKLKIETEVYKSTQIKTIYKQTIFNKDGEKKVEAFVTIVCIHKSDFKPVRVDRELKELYDSYKKEGTY